MQFRTDLRYVVLSALMLSLSAFAAQAAENGVLSIEDEMLFFESIPSVFGASKYEQKVTDAPSRISIVTAEEIRRFGYRTFSEILRSLPGFSTNNDRNYSYTGVRGFGVPGDYDTRLLQLVDGHRINDNLYGSLYSDHTFPVDLNVIERIEVIRGPSSSLYGSGAFFGVVNVITKQGRDINGLEVSGAAGSHSSKQGQITYGQRLTNGLELLMSGTMSESDGDDRLYYPEFDSPDTNSGVADDVDNEKFHKVFTRASIGDFALEAVYGKREKDIPTASYGTVFNAKENQTWDKRGYLDLKYQTLLADGAEVIGRLHYDVYQYEGEYLYDYGDVGEPYLSVNYDSADGRWWGADLQWGKQLGMHHVIVGTEYRDSLKEQQGNFDQDGVYLDVDSDSDLWAVFAQDEIRLRDNLVLNLGLRHDDYSEFGGTTNPRLAVIWSPLMRSTIKLLYGEAFRAPNAYELYYNDSGFTTKPSLDLDPETIRTYELILEQQLTDSLRGVISVYHNDINDLIALDRDPADDLLVFVNQGDAEAKGVEIELENHWLNGAHAALSYTYQDAENSNTGDRLVNYATDMVKLNVMTPLMGDRLGAALETQYESGRDTIRGNTTDDRWLVNFGFYSEQWIDRLDVSLTVYNLFDENFADPGSEEHTQDSIEQDGRTFRLRFDYAF